MKLAQFEANEYILEVLEGLKNGNSKDNIVALLVSDEISKEEADDFFEGLAECKLIVSELEPTLTGLENIDRCIQILERNLDLTELEPLLSQLREAKIELERFDNTSDNPVEDYLALKGQFDFNASNMFGINSLMNCSKESTLLNVWQNRLIQSIGFLNNIKSESPPADLLSFKDQFERRFGNNKVPLLNALETLGYAQSAEVVDLP
jgi:lantibiotic biosynthesis protein